jgi:hypothetical protein
MVLPRQRLNLVEGFHNYSRGQWGCRMLMTRIPHIPASVTALMAAVVFVAPLIVMLVVGSRS